MIRLTVLSSLLLSASTMDVCEEPSVFHGSVKGTQGENSFSGRVSCDAGYLLVGGSSFLKCRNGQWSGKIPVCSVIGACQELPVDLLRNGRVIPVRKSRKSAYKFQCRRGFTLLGERRTYCQGDNWSHQELPVCAKPGCEESALEFIKHGHVRPIIRGAAYKFHCEEGAFLHGSPMLFCDGRKWNDSVPECQVHPGMPLLEIVDEYGIILQDTTVILGNNITFTCCQQGGNPIPEVEIYISQEGETDLPMVDGDSLSLTVGLEYQGLRVSCKAHNSVGEEDTSLDLRVMAEPAHVNIVGLSLIQQGSPATFSCQTEGGIPEPELQWSIENADYLTILSGGQNNSVTFYHEDLEVENVEGFLLNCVAVNEAAEVKATKEVTVGRGPGSVLVVGPTILYQDNSYEFLCEVTGGNPEPEISWSVEAFSQEEPTWEILSANKLLMSVPDTLRGGVTVYCEAANVVGTKTSQISSYVAYLPRSLSVSVPDTAYPGDVVTLLCSDADEMELVDLDNQVPADLEWKLEGFGAKLVNSEKRGEAEIIIADKYEEEEFVLMVQCFASFPDTDKEVASNIHEIVVSPLEEITEASEDQELVTLAPEEEYYYEYEEEESTTQSNDDSFTTLTDFVPENHTFLSVDTENIPEETSRLLTGEQNYDSDDIETTEEVSLALNLLEVENGADDESELDDHETTSIIKSQISTLQPISTVSVTTPEKPNTTNALEYQSESEHFNDNNSVSKEDFEVPESPESIPDITPLKQIDETNKKSDNHISVKTFVSPTSAGNQLKVTFTFLLLVAVPSF